jgi:hypothetical protein
MLRFDRSCSSEWMNLDGANVGYIRHRKHFMITGLFFETNTTKVSDSESDDPSRIASVGQLWFKPLDEFLLSVLRAFVGQYPNLQFSADVERADTISVFCRQTHLQVCAAKDVRFRVTSRRWLLFPRRIHADSPPNRPVKNCQKDFT